MLKGKGRAQAVVSKRGPINALPPEVLGEIFLASLGKSFPTHDDDSIPPLQFCRVCTYWQQTALSTPGLWTRLLINRFDLPQDISKWFSSAGELPLSIRIQLNGPHPSSVPSFRVPLQRYMGRIHNLEISVRRIEDAVQQLNNFVDPETDLERLVIQYDQSTSPSNAPGLKFLRLHKLKRLMLSNRCLGRQSYDGSFDNMPWNQLTHLSMVDVPIMPLILMTFLRRCTHLQRGFFALSNLLHPTNQWITMLHGDTVFPSMISLKVVFTYAGEWGILDGLSFPSLKTLCLGSTTELSTWSSTTSATLHTPLLRNLTLFRIRIQYPDLVEFLTTKAGLRVLVLDTPLNFSPFFEKLSHIGDNIFLPNLTRLSLYNWRLTQKHPIKIDIKALCQMIRARWYPRSTKPRPARSPLSSVLLRMPRIPVYLIGIKMLTPLVAQGLFLHIGSRANGYQLRKEVDW